MNNKPTNTAWFKETAAAMLVMLVAGAVMITSPMTIFIAPVLMPAFLLFVLAAQGLRGFLLTLAAGAVPFLALGGGLILLSIGLPGLLTTAALYAAVKLKLKFPAAFSAVAFAALIGTVLTMYLSIYVISGSDIMAFTRDMADAMRNGVLTVAEGRGYELPPSQLQLFNEVAAGITPEFVQDMLPGTATILSLLQGYFVLRLGRRFLNRFQEFRLRSVPLIGRIRISPFLLFAFLMMAGLGSLLTRDGERMGSLLFNTGSMVIAFLGTAGAMSLIWNFAETNLKMRHPFNKALITLTAVFFFSGSWMIILTIVDSILDLRNITGTSLYRWLRFKIFENKGEES